MKIAREAFAILVTHRNRAKPFEKPASSPAKSPKRSPSGSFLHLFQQSAFLAFLAAMVCLLVYRDIETSKIRMAETQRIANEKGQADSERKNRELALKQAEREADLAEKELELQAKRMELEQRSAEDRKVLAIRQIENEKDINLQSLDVARTTAKADANLVDSEARGVNAESRWKEHTVERQIDDEAFAVKAELALRQKYQEQRLNGEDRITRSNPGMDRW